MKCKWCHKEMNGEVSNDNLEECFDCNKAKWWMEQDLHVAAHMLSALFTKNNTARGGVFESKEECKDADSNES